MPGSPAPVHHIFWPLTTKRSPLSSAKVRRAAASEPASGSDIPIESRVSPRMSGGEQGRRCSVGTPPLQEEAAHEREDEALRHVEAGPAESLGDDRQLGGAAPAAAVALGERQLEPAEVGEAPEELLGIVVGRRPTPWPVRAGRRRRRTARRCPAACACSVSLSPKSITSSYY